MPDPSSAPLIGVAVPSPLRQLFVYLPPQRPVAMQPGMRVRVPFGPRNAVGVIVSTNARSDLPTSRLRRIERVLDDEPVLDSQQMKLLMFTSEYFQHPVGEVVSTMLPTRLRHGRGLEMRTALEHRITDLGRKAIASGEVRGPRQREALEQLVRSDGGVSASALTVSGDVLRRLIKAGWVESAPASVAAPRAGNAPPSLSEEQRIAVEAIIASDGGFASFLLDGVTGSGKTEVYLAVIEGIIERGRQALVLIPEIGLTPQTVQRFEQRLGVPVAAMHSGLADGERHLAWQRARSGDALVVVGTRSAVFAPVPRLGVVIVDEEHDASFKQHDGVRYSARDLAVVRARDAAVPIVLGSATPSLESLHNAASGRYRRLTLSQRAGGASAPKVEVVDLRGRNVEAGVSQPMLDALERCLAERDQAILFVNRRGYAPVLLCRECGQPVDCERCDAHMVLHQADDRLHCHHCAFQRSPPANCACGGELRAVGVGTQRVLEMLEQRFPHARVARVDRDSMRRRGEMARLLDRVARHEVDVLVGTQMLAKGHHFPGVTLVGILDGDAGLFSTDFRAPERMAQLLVQVAGRAGRAERAGRVLIQTHHPDNALLRTLVTRGYHAFGDAALAERRELGLPPFGYLALVRAEAVNATAATEFLDAARAAAPSVDGTLLLGPVPSPMPRRAGRHRAQLLVESGARGDLKRLLQHWLPRLGALPAARRVRWSVDVDPQDMA